MFQTEIIRNLNEFRSDIDDKLGPVRKATQNQELEPYPIGRFAISTGSLLSDLDVKTLANLSSLISPRLVEPSAIDN